MEDSSLKNVTYIKMFKISGKKTTQKNKTKRLVTKYIKMATLQVKDTSCSSENSTNSSDCTSSQHHHCTEQQLELFLVQLRTYIVNKSMDLAKSKNTKSLKREYRTCKWASKITFRRLWVRNEFSKLWFYNNLLIIIIIVLIINFSMNQFFLCLFQIIYLARPKKNLMH